MSYRLVLLFSVLLCCFGSIHASVTVGTCESTRHPYSTITAAIEAVPDGGEIHVCPGTYPEKFTIQKSVTIRGIGNVTVTFPTAGLASQPAPSEPDPLYTQVFVNNAGGPVLISNITIQGGDLFFPVYPGSPVENGNYACATDAIGYGNYWGVASVNSFVVLDHVSVGGQTAYPQLPGTLSQLPIYNIYCGNGIRFQGGKGVVTHSVVSVGLTGILGASTVDHTSVTIIGGSYSSGISASASVIDNTVIGPGYAYGHTVGISGGEEIRGNVVQGWVTGITAEVIKHNTFLQNVTAVSGAKDISDIQIISDKTYPNPACYFQAFCNGTPTPTVLPTTAIDLGCSDGTRIRNNSIVDASIAFANLDPNRTVSPTNVLYNVTTTSTTCPQ